MADRIFEVPAPCSTCGTDRKHKDGFFVDHTTDACIKALVARIAVLESERAEPVDITNLESDVTDARDDVRGIRSEVDELRSRLDSVANALAESVQVLDGRANHTEVKLDVMFRLFEQRLLALEAQLASIKK